MEAPWPEGKQEEDSGVPPPTPPAAVRQPKRTQNNPVGKLRNDRPQPKRQWAKKSTQDERDDSRISKKRNGRGPKTAKKDAEVMGSIVASMQQALGSVDAKQEIKNAERESVREQAADCAEKKKLDEKLAKEEKAQLKVECDTKMVDDAFAYKKSGRNLKYKWKRNNQHKFLQYYDKVMSAFVLSYFVKFLKLVTRSPVAYMVRVIFERNKWNMDVCDSVSSIVEYFLYLLIALSIIRLLLKTWFRYDYLYIAKPSMSALPTDMRADSRALGDIKHSSPQLCQATFWITAYWWGLLPYHSKTVRMISLELFTQLTTQSFMPADRKDDLIYASLNKGCSSLHSINIPRQASLFGEQIEQSTVKAAFCFFLSQKHIARRLESVLPVGAP